MSTAKVSKVASYCVNMASNWVLYCDFHFHFCELRLGKSTSNNVPEFTLKINEQMANTNLCSCGIQFDWQNSRNQFVITIRVAVVEKCRRTVAYWYCFFYCHTILSLYGHVKIIFPACFCVCPFGQFVLTWFNLKCNGTSCELLTK